MLNVYTKLLLILFKHPIEINQFYFANFKLYFVFKTVWATWSAAVWHIHLYGVYHLSQYVKLSLKNPHISTILFF